MSTDETEFRRLERHLITIESKLSWLIGLLGAMAVTSSGAINFPMITQPTQLSKDGKDGQSTALSDPAHLAEMAGSTAAVESNLSAY